MTAKTGFGYGFIVWNPDRHEQRGYRDKTHMLVQFQKQHNVVAFRHYKIDCCGYRIIQEWRKYETNRTTV